MIKKILPAKNVILLLVFWLVVVLFMMFNSYLLTNLTPTKSLLVFGVLLITIIAAAFSVIGEADKISEILGEPYGTLILTLSIVIIEVALILSMLFGPVEAPEIAKDSVFSVMMIILNLILGICLIIGGNKYKGQNYNAQGTFVYLALIVILAGIGLILPTFMVGNGAGEFTLVQAYGVAFATLILYGIFISYQVGSFSFIFKQPANGGFEYEAVTDDDKNSKQGMLPEVKKEIIYRSVILVLFILPIVLLAHNLGAIVDYGIEEFDLPLALGGVLIAIIVFTPESMAAIKAATNNEMQKTINLCHGAFVATLGLTIPGVLLIGLFTNKKILLGLNGVEIFLFLVTILLSLITFNGRKTNPLLGFAHLILFFIYILFIFYP